MVRITSLLFIIAYSVQNKKNLTSLNENVLFEWIHVHSTFAEVLFTLN